MGERTLWRLYKILGGVNMDFRKMNAEEKRWRGRDDAYVLAQSEAIKADKERYANAQKEARNMVNEREKELNGMRKVAGKSQKRVSGNQQTNTNNPWGRDLMAMPTSRY